MKSQLVVAPLIPAAVADRARATFEAYFAEGNVEAALAAVDRLQADAMFITSSVKLTGDVIAGLPSCLKIAATCSVGFDHIDVGAAKARGLIVTNTPEVLTDCTADLAFMLILNACRRAHEYEVIMRSGWRKSFGLGDMLGTRASGKTLGIVGFGRIGRAVAQRARGFGMRILYHNRNRIPDELAQGAEYFSDLRTMLPHCQILSLHAPGGAANERMMNAETFALLPSGAIFVNAARGALVDEDALIAALKSGHLAGAGLDVFRSEPGFDLRLADLPNIFLTPHMGSATVETRNAMGFRALDNLAAVCAGRPAIDPLWS